jgi:branched-chain amino acid transport system ATP-binding protein
VGGGDGKVLLECTGLSKLFGGVRALMDVDIVVREKEIAGIIGPNGSGKTTFLNVVSGIYKPSDGVVMFEGRDITGMPSYRVAREGVGRTYQNIRLFRNQSCEENVLVGLHTKRSFWSSRKKAMSRVTELMDFVGLTARRKTLAGSLPYGDQRKLEIARALAADPLLLLLDEPGAGMGVKEAEGLADLFLELRRLGTTMLIIDHNMKVIMNVVDKVAVFDAGRKIKEGTPADIQSDPEIQELYFGDRAC